jgi:hypothetical protein
MTPTERKQKERDTRREAGLVRLEVWVRPEVRDEVRAYAEKRTRAAVKAAGLSSRDADGVA